MAVEAVDVLIFLVRVSLDVLPLVWTSAVPLAAVAAVAAVCALSTFAWRKNRSAEARRSRRSWTRWGLEMSSLLVAPIAMLLLALALWRYSSNGNFGHTSWGQTATTCLVVAQVALAIWLSWRHRDRPISTFLVAIPMTLVVFATSFTASMAIANSWL